MCLADHCSLLVVMDNILMSVIVPLCDEVTWQQPFSWMPSRGVIYLFIYFVFGSRGSPSYLQFSSLSQASAWLLSHWERFGREYFAFVMFLFTFIDLVETYFPWHLWFCSGVCRVLGLVVSGSSWAFPLFGCATLLKWFPWFKEFVGWNGKLFLKCSVVNPWS